MYPRMHIAVANKVTLQNPSEKVHMHNFVLVSFSKQEQRLITWISTSKLVKSMHYMNSITEITGTVRSSNLKVGKLLLWAAYIRVLDDISQATLEWANQA